MEWISVWPESHQSSWHFGFFVFILLDDLKMAFKFPLKMTTAAAKTNTAWVIININKSQHDNVDTTVLG